MTTKFSFEIRTGGVTLVILFFVIATGILTYRNIKSIADDVNDASKPDIKISLLKQITSDLSDAESSVKSYNLTGDRNYLTPFYNAVGSIDEKISQLQFISAYNSAQRKFVDSIEVLVEEKYSILNKLLNLRYDQSIIDELEMISRKLDQKSSSKTIESFSGEAPELIPSRKEDRTSNIFKRIFGKRKTVSTNTETVSPAEEKKENTQSPAQMRKVQKEVIQDIEKVKEKQSRQFIEIRAEELELTRKDKEVMDKIRSVITKIEQQERAFIAAKTKKASLRAKQTNIVIAIFCLVASILLLTACLTVIGYVRKRHLYENALNEARLEAENHVKAKEIFLANMSHEIRTPMNAIAGFTEQLMHSGLNDNQYEQAEIVKKSSDHLLKVINDILDYSKMQAGKLEFEKVGFRLIDIINETFKLMSKNASSKDLELNYVIGKHVPEIVIGDPVRLRQVLINLVHNAIKFTEKGSVKIDVQCRHLDNKNARFFFKVKDTGIGIPQDKVDVIFNEFEQADKGVTRNYGGTGLGLSITKILIESQGGDIYINSTVGKGTEVIFNLPLKKGQVSDLETESEIIPESFDMGGRSVLVADDEDFNRRLLASIMGKWNVKIVEARNGKEALEKIKDGDFDLALLDVRMPEMNGLELAMEIRKLEDSKKRNLPIIAISAATSTEDMIQYRASGMNDIIAKPFREQELLSKIQKMLAGRKSGNNKVSRNVIPKEKEAPMKSDSHIDLNDLKQLSNGDTAFVNEMLTIFIKTTTQEIDLMNEGLKQENWKRISDSAHKIVPPCRHVGAMKLHDTLKLIEKRAHDLVELDSLPELVNEATRESEVVIKELEAILHKAA
jgi:signal transduction histidine kinase/CheY-like chemotaxis protein/HPt (histidine-containing phosphotransfer) domain-containing protein